MVRLHNRRIDVLLNGKDSIDELFDCKHTIFNFVFIKILSVATVLLSTMLRFVLEKAGWQIFLDKWIDMCDTLFVKT